jgi:hypothetical protein
MKFLLSFILFIYVFVSTPLLELAKLPQLYTHYIEHKKENHQLSFAGFLYLHYGDEDHAENHHNSLPFKSCNENTVVSIQMPLNEVRIGVNQMFCSTSEVLNFFYKSRYTFQYLTAIWQPPKN